MAEDLPPDDEADDDRPRRRRRRPRDDDDDFDGGPRKKKSNTAVIVVVVLAVTLLPMCVCVPVGIGLLLPAVQKVREAAARQSSQNNLKIMALAMHNGESATGAFQGPFAAGAGGPATGHSFRVGLLPYMERDSLYKQIDLTQPWNSPKNNAATGTSIKDFLDPGNPASTGTATPYRMFVGPGAMFDGSNKMPTLGTITDGTSNTIMFVAATATVPWASPQELPYGPGVPLPPLGSTAGALGFNAAFADGSVRFIKSTIPQADLRSLIEKADGRAVTIP